MRPAEWELRSATLVGAPAVYGELMGWLADLRSGAAPPDPAQPQSSEGNRAG